MDSSVKDYSQLASAKLAIYLKNTLSEDWKLSFLLGLLFILCWILQMKAFVRVKQ